MAHLISLSPDGKRFRVSLEYHADTFRDVLARFRAAVPAARFVREGRYWDVPGRWGSCEGLAAFLAADGSFVLGDGVAGRLAAMAREHAGLYDASRAESVEAFPRERIPAGLELRPYQEAGVLYALQAERTFIADDMGLGKTVESAVALWLADAFPAVVVCPPAVLLNWRKELRTWCPGKTITVLKGRSSSQAYHADIVIVSWINLAAHVKALQAERPVGVIYDEFHWAKNATSDRGKAAIALSSRPRYLFGLTGTAVENSPIELIAQLRALRRLQDFGGSTFYKMRYCAPTEKTIERWDPVQRRRVSMTVKEYKGASNLVELNKKLRATCYLRREKSVVMSELPEKQRVVVDLEIDNRAEYVQARDRTASWLREQGRNVPKSIGMSKLDGLKKVAALGKVSGVVSWASEFAANREKLILFAWHVPVQQALADALEAKGFRVVRLVAGMTDVERFEAVERFQTDPGVAFVVASLSAWPEGWTGTAASNVAFLEFWWTPTRHDQAEDRAHRFGQRNAVTGWYLRGLDTVDEPSIALLDSKRKTTDAVNSGEVVEADESILAGMLAWLAGDKRAFDAALL